MPTRNLPIALTGLLLLAGCGVSGPLVGGADGLVSLTGRIRVQAAQTAPAKAFHLLQIVTVPQPGDVKAVRVFLQRTDTAGPEYLLGTLPGTTIPVALRSLRQNATYKLRLEADNEGGSRIDNNATTAAEPDLGLCESSFSTTTSPSGDPLSFRLRLADAPFSGTTLGNVDVNLGGYEAPAQAESLASGAFLDATSVFQPQLLEHNGRDYLLNFNELAGGLVHLHFNPRGHNDQHPDYLSPGLFNACGTFESQGVVPIGNDPDGIPHRLKARKAFLASVRAGYKGVMVSGNLISVPFYRSSSFFNACSLN